MKHLSLETLSETVSNLRRKEKMSQAVLAEQTGINRTLISRIENGSFMPSIPQLEALAASLGFDPAALFQEKGKEQETGKEDVQGTQRLHIAVAGTGYVGLSLATLLSQQHHVTAVDILQEKVDQINRGVSPIRDEYIEAFLAEKEKRGLDLTAVSDGDMAYREADYIVIATPTNYDSRKNFFDTSTVESVIEQVLRVNQGRPEEERPMMVIKSTIPVGYTESVREKYHTNRILFSPEFLRESKALYDNLYPSRIIVGCDESSRAAAETFASLLQQAAIKKDIPTPTDRKSVV